jgi:hypothetical protein
MCIASRERNANRRPRQKAHARYARLASDLASGSLALGLDFRVVARWAARARRALLEDYSAGCAAGLSCTDSPQPQADVWFGLLNTNWAASLSVL